MRLPLPLFTLHLIPFLHLLHLTTASRPPPTSTTCTPSSYDSILNTLSTYPLAIDSKDFPLLSEVFTPTAVANYSAPLNVLTGLAQIESVLESSLRPVMTQHMYGTQKIDVYGNGSADVVTYYTANHFGVGPFEGQVYYAYGKYVDNLVEIEDGGWRIDKRHLIYMGPGIGNASIFTGALNATGAPTS